MMQSLRYRLVIGTCLSGAIVLALLGVSVYLAMQHALMKEFDATLISEARLLEGMLEFSGGKISFEFDPQQMPEFGSGKGRQYFELWRADGSVMARSASLNKGDLPAGTIKSGAVGAIIAHGDDIERAVSLQYQPHSEDVVDDRPAAVGPTITIMVAAEPTDVNHTLYLLGGLLTVLCAAAVAVMGAVMLRVVGQGLSPLKKVAGTIAGLRETDLSYRLSRDGVPDELLAIVDKLNGLLERLQSAFAREKAFTADVAHELRTPLAGLRATMEVTRTKRREPADYEAAIDECRGITDRMESMVSTLLMLARTDAGQMKVTREKVDLATLTSETWEPYVLRALERKLAVTLEDEEAVEMESDAEKLRIVLNNLMDNAVSYADLAGKIRITVKRADGAAVFEIANTGSRIAQIDAAELFERFRRGDSARADTGTHCGLGLSLSQRLVKLMHGEISIETRPGGEFIVRVRFAPQTPLPPPAFPVLAPN